MEEQSHYGIIYEAYNKNNGKRYIGQTTQSLKKRIRQHYSSDGCPLFHRALIKYPKNIWEWKIIDVAESVSDLNNKEIFWIKFFCSNEHSKGYNLARGGQGGDSMSPAQKQQLHITACSKNINTKFTPTDNSRHMYRCRETGEIFPNAMAAARAQNRADSHAIIKAAQNNTLSYGYHWDLLTKEEEIRKSVNSFYCIELDEYFQNFSQCHRAEGFQPDRLSQVMHQGDPYKDKCYAGYTFRWTDPDKHIETDKNKNEVKTPIIIKNPHAERLYTGITRRNTRKPIKAVIYYNKKTFYIGSFFTIKEAVEAYNKKATEIGKPIQIYQGEFLTKAEREQALTSTLSITKNSEL